RAPDGPAKGLRDEETTVALAGPEGGRLRPASPRFAPRLLVARVAVEDGVEAGAHLGGRARPVARPAPSWRQVGQRGHRPLQRMVAGARTPRIGAGRDHHVAPMVGVTGELLEQA